MKCYGIHFYLFEHGEQTIGAGWREMAAQADGVDEGDIGIDDLFWGMAGEHLYEQTDQSFCDDGIAVGGEEEFAVLKVYMEPDAGLAPFNEDRKSTRLNSSHGYISYAVFCLK